MASSFGLVGAGAASAAEPSNHIANGQTWTIEENGGGCQRDVFSSAGTFVSPDTQYHGDAGKWNQTATTMTMKWTAGDDFGLKFKGTYQSAGKEFVGKFGGILKGEGVTGQLVEGAVADC